MSEEKKAELPKRIWANTDLHLGRLIANYGPWRSIYGEPLEYLSLQEAQERERLLTEALEFYASNETWICSHDFYFGDCITSDDLEENSPISKRKYVGGKRARLTLAKIRGTNG